MIDDVPPPGSYITVEPAAIPRRWRAVLRTAGGAAWTTGLLYADLDEVREYAREWAKRARVEYRPC